MSWLGWLGLAVIITVILAVTGIKPKGTRHVAHTRLMGMARLALLVKPLHSIAAVDDPRTPARFPGGCAVI